MTEEAYLEALHFYKRFAKKVAGGKDASEELAMLETLAERHVKQLGSNAKIRVLPPPSTRKM